MKTYGIIQQLNESVEDYQDKLSVKFMAKIFNQMRKNGWDGREETADEYFDRIIAKLENREQDRELTESLRNDTKEAIDLAINEIDNGFSDDPDWSLKMFPTYNDLVQGVYELLIRESPSSFGIDIEGKPKVTSAVKFSGKEEIIEEIKKQLAYWGYTEDYPSKINESENLKEALGDRFEVWETYYEDGTQTTEYVQSFDTYEEANKFAESLAEDPNCDAWVKDTKLDESEKPDNSKHAILSRVFAKYPDISKEDEDYLNSLPLDGLINEVMDRGWNDVLEESENDEAYLSNLANEILNWYDSDMGNHFDEIAGDEEELYNKILSVLANKDTNSIKAFIEDIEGEGLEEDKELVDKLKALTESEKLAEDEDNLYFHLELAYEVKQLWDELDKLKEENAEWKSYADLYNKVTDNAILNEEFWKSKTQDELYEMCKDEIRSLLKFYHDNYAITFDYGRNSDGSLKVTVRELKPMDESEVIPNHNGLKCPKCGSANYVEVDDGEDEDGTLHFHYECGDCGFSGEDDEVLIETTNRGIEDRKEALYTKTRQILKDKGDPNWENLMGLKGRLSDEELAEYQKERIEISTIEMIHSILTYSPTSLWTVDYVMADKYLQSYIKELGMDKVKELVQQEIDEYVNNATIDRDVYTDNEGLTYNTVRFKNE